MSTRLLSTVAFLLFAVAAAVTGEAGRVPLWKNLEGFGRTITTSSPESQKYFNQGFTLHYAFNHTAAIASYKQAVELDPDCAMVWWGQALSAGPNISNTYMDSAAAYLAWTAIKKAQDGYILRTYEFIPRMGGRWTVLPNAIIEPGDTNRPKKRTRCSANRGRDQI